MASSVNRTAPILDVLDVGNYRISGQELSKGTTGVIVPAFNKKTSSPCIAKISVPDKDIKSNIRTLRHEASILERASGIPHVVEMEAHFPLSLAKNQQPFPGYALILEEARCCSRCRVPQNARMELKEKGIQAYGFKTIVSAIAQLLESLVGLNGRNLTHCDIKSQNYIINESGLVTLVDFGNATPLDELVNDQSRTTATHRPPEMYLQKKETDFTVDMWGVGVLLFELYTGGRVPFPWDADDEWSPLRRILATLGLPSDEYLKSTPYNQKALEKCTNPTFFSCWREEIHSAATCREHSSNRANRIIDFLARIFCYDNRMTAKEALRHPLLCSDVHVLLDASPIPPSARKELRLQVGNRTFPLYRCLHFPRRQDNLYRVRLINIKTNQCQSDIICTLTSGDVLPVVYPNLSEEEKQPE